MPEQVWRLTELIKNDLGEMPDFKPCMFVNGLDELVILWKDCSYTEELDSSRRFSLLRHTHGSEVVGIIIPNSSQFFNRLST